MLTNRSLSSPANNCTSSYLAQVYKHRLACVLPTILTVLAQKGAIKSLSIGAAGIFLVVLLVGHALQPARVLSYPVPVVISRLEPGVCD